MRPVWLAALLTSCEGTAALPSDGSPPDPAEDCPSADDFTIGAAKTSPGGVTVTLTDAAPIPPYRGDNTWTFALSDANGPLDGESPVLTPFMPLHGHGLVPPDYVGAEADPGIYPIPTFDLSMSGQWEFTVDVGDGDSVVYTFCIGG